jgi:hypothetical protein
MRRYFNLFVVLTLATLSRAQVRAWEGTLVLPTYEEGMPESSLRPVHERQVQLFEAAGTTYALHLIT